MSRGAAMAQAVVPFAPKSNSKSEAGDQLDRAGQAILGALHRAAGAAEANYQQAVEVTHKLSAQLRSAEDRITQLEATVRHHEDRADRAEKWLYQISMEIEQNSSVARIVAPRKANGDSPTIESKQDASGAIACADVIRQVRAQRLAKTRSDIDHEMEPFEIAP